MKTRKRPASLQRRRVAGETPSKLLASDRPIQSGSRDAERVIKPTQIYQNVADSLTVPFQTRKVLARAAVPPNVDCSARLLVTLHPYEVIEASRLPVIFHTGHSGIGAGLRGGSGIRLKYGNPMDLDDVAADFPDLTIILAHPSFPWQDEALSVSLHKPNVYLDLSGWLPRHFPPQLVQYADTLLADKVMFGSDYPMISPDRWLADFAELKVRDDVRPRILKGTAARLLGLDAQNG